MTIRTEQAKIVGLTLMSSTPLTVYTLLSLLTLIVLVKIEMPYIALQIFGVLFGIGMYFSGLYFAEAFIRGHEQAQMLENVIEGEKK